VDPTEFATPVVIGEAEPVPVTVFEPLVQLAVNVWAEPPLLPAVNATVKVVLLFAVTDTPVGALGTRYGVAVPAEIDEDAPPGP
jgi:hypothetical protein